MKLSQLVGQRLKEAPRDAQTASHIFLIRGGYVRLVSAGLYTLLPLGRRITRKIEQILREEMDRVDGQEIRMPVVLPADLWEESGRYGKVGSELLRFKDRNGKDMLLGMTHEEAVVQVARTELVSYKQLPSMLYQIQTKYRDEARPRAGLIRVREFTMKDAYSFHNSQECLEKYYERCHEAYVRIFKRIGLKQCLSILSDSGMMGGAVSHEFMAIADCGEDTIFASPDGSYRANREVATAKLAFTKDAPQPLSKVHTPNCKTIADVAGFLKLSPEQTCKAVFYKDQDNKLVFACIRGDLEVNEAKLRKAIQCPEIDFANDELIRAAGAVPGFASLLGIDANKIRVVVDPSVSESSNLVVGANEEDHHMLNFNFARDAAGREHIIVTDIATVREGDPCPLTGQPLQALKGIEVGNIFQLGTKYSAPMSCNYLDQDGKSKPMIMGCYGIGVGRAMAAVIEQCHDDYGPVWPMAIAPFQVHLIGLNINQPEVRQACDKLYQSLIDAGIDALYDDRGEKAGFAFADADLIGVPLRLVVSPKTLAQNQVEFKQRSWGKRSELIALDGVLPFVQQQIQELMALCRPDTPTA
ncbi:MAG: proline--tRNA ligase [Lentisphaeria bacterium]|nr:proline--tRNA ligase [Lentisphaeria bacterium]